LTEATTAPLDQFVVVVVVVVSGVCVVGVVRRGHKNPLRAT
jgi:hypothetical protein